MKPDTGRKSRFLLTPSAFDDPVSGVPCRNIAVKFGTVKLEWCGYTMVKKNPRIRVLVLTEFTNVTDTQTDIWTPYDGIGRNCIASRVKNTRGDKHVVTNKLIKTDELGGGGGQEAL